MGCIRELGQGGLVDFYKMFPMQDLLSCSIVAECFICALVWDSKPKGLGRKKGMITPCDSSAKKL